MKLLAIIFTISFFILATHSAKAEIVVLEDRYASYSGGVIYDAGESMFLNSGSLSSTGNAIVVGEGFSNSSDSSVAITVDASTDIIGLNSDLELSVANLSFQGAARSDLDGSLKSKVSIEIVDGFYSLSNPELTLDPFTCCVNDGPVLNPNGVPERFGAISGASYNKALYVEGDETIEQLRMTVSLDGFIESSLLNLIDTDELFDTFMRFEYGDINRSILGQFDNGGFGVFEHGMEGLFDITLEIDFLVVDNIVQVGFDISTSIIADLSFYDGIVEPSVFGSSVDFFNTFTIDSVAGFDANGNQVRLSGVTDTSGNSLNVTNVPSPAIGYFGVLGLAGMIFFKRKRTKNKNSEDKISYTLMMYRIYVFPLIFRHKKARPN